MSWTRNNRLVAGELERRLAGHDRRAHAVAVLEDREQVVAVLGAERSQRSEIPSFYHVNQ